MEKAGSQFPHCFLNFYIVIKVIHGHPQTVQVQEEKWGHSPCTHSLKGTLWIIYFCALVSDQKPEGKVQNYLFVNLNKLLFTPIFHLNQLSHCVEQQVEEDLEKKNFLTTPFFVILSDSL